MPKIAVVVPTIRPEMHASFVKAWAPLFEKHRVTLVTVWDGDDLEVEIQGQGKFKHHELPIKWSVDANRDLFCRRTDACRNLGFVVAARLGAEVIVTMDDDVAPLPTIVPGFTSTNDPIQSHLDALAKRVPVSWMNTAHDTDLYLRGVPYGVRDEAPVMMSHGVWVGTPDFDGETQLRLEANVGVPSYPGNGVPYSLPYYVGPVPKGVNFPVCGMSLAFRREALPYVYFAPMGPDSGVEGLNRFADIWMGCMVKREFDRLGWAIYTGASTVLHTRASDARKNFEQEKLGREWNESMWKNGDWNLSPEYVNYWHSYKSKRGRYAALITSIMEKGK